MRRPSSPASSRTRACVICQLGQPAEEQPGLAGQEQPDERRRLARRRSLPSLRASKRLLPASDLEVRAAFAPLFKQYGVQLALAGHDYQRTRSIDGTTYLVSGAAAKLRPAGSNADTVMSQSVRHFLDVSVYADRLVVQPVDQAGRVFDGLVLPAP